MARRYLPELTNWESPAFRAVELDGTLQIDEIGSVCFNQVLLLDAERETLCFVEANIRLIVTLAFLAKRSEYRTRLPDATAGKSDAFIPVSEIASAHGEKSGCMNPFHSATFREQVN